MFKTQDPGSGRLLDRCLLTQTALRTAPLDRRPQNRKDGGCQSGPLFIKINSNGLQL